MFYCVKGFGEVQLEDHNFPSRVMTLVYILKCSSQAVLDSPCFDKTILIEMYLRDDFLLNP
jgi:hypothetical protein